MLIFYNSFKLVSHLFSIKFAKLLCFGQNKTNQEKAKKIKL